jgi:hypothetical protein
MALYLHLSNKVSPGQWRWIRHIPRKPKYNITRQAMQWNHQGMRGRERPKNTWRDFIAEMEI